jgi:hypothetical protein
MCLLLLISQGRAHPPSLQDDTLSLDAMSAPVLLPVHRTLAYTCLLPLGEPVSLA